LVLCACLSSGEVVDEQGPVLPKAPARHPGVAEAVEDAHVVGSGRTVPVPCPHRCGYRETHRCWQRSRPSVHRRCGLAPDTRPKMPATRWPSIDSRLTACTGASVGNNAKVPSDHSAQPRPSMGSGWAALAQIHRCVGFCLVKSCFVKGPEPHAFSDTDLTHCCPQTSDLGRPERCRPRRRSR
jgi:hypothetical protein